MTQHSVSSPAQFTPRTVSNLMAILLLCLCPAIALSTWFFGIGLLLNISIAATAAVVFEWICLTFRGKNPITQLADFSALVTATLFALSIPPGTHWGLVVAGVAFAIVIAKHAYGGLGQNLFNPAMAGYLFLLLSCPLDMTSWHIPLQGLDSHLEISPLSIEGIKQSFVVSFPFLFTNSAALVDGMTMATPLIEYKMASPNAIAKALTSNESIWARSTGTGWEVISLAYLFGGIALLGLKVIRWHIPVAIIATLTLLSIAFYSPGSAAITGTPYMHLFNGATFLGAFFIATDPVSAATTNQGRLVYGAIIGISIYCIRVWGSYLDAVAIAVIFANFWAPLLDYIFKPRVYGHQSALSRLWNELRS